MQFFQRQKKSGQKGKITAESVDSKCVAWLQFFQIKRPVDFFARLSEKKADKRAGLQPELAFAAYPRCPVFLMRHRRLISTCQSIFSVRRVISEVKFVNATRFVVVGVGVRTIRRGLHSW